MKRNCLVILAFGVLPLAAPLFAQTTAPETRSAKNVSSILKQPGTMLAQVQGQRKAQPTSASISRPAAIVSMTDNKLAFEPAVITIQAGQTVEWKNSSHQVHNVVADPSKASNPKDVELPKGAQPFSSGYLDPGQTYVHTFNKPGTYRYVCTLHEAQHMVGQVIVKP